MFQKLTTAVGSVLLFSASLCAQEVDSLPVATFTPQRPVASIEVNTDSVVKRAMALLSHKKEGLPLPDLEEAKKYDSLWLQELYNNEQEFSALPLEEISPSGKHTFRESLPTDTLKARLALLNEKTPLNITYNPYLERVIQSFLSNKRKLIQQMITASQFYFPLFEQELDRYDIPLEVKYLAVVESALNPRAQSGAGARGLWQFMYSTGKMYGLEVSNYVDERSDPVLATKAACQYLSSLYAIFKDWNLALAAYNSGPGNVSKAIRRSGGYTNYWNIRAFLPSETAEYLPTFLATLYLFEYAQAHGLQYKKAARPYFETDTVHVKNYLTFEQVATLVGMSIEALEMLNPAYKLNVIPKITGKTYALRLPKSKIGAFVHHEAAIYAYAQKELDALEKPLPQLVAVASQIRYKVKSGDYLGKIAERYGVSVSQIKQWNQLKNTHLHIGQRLIIFPKLIPDSTQNKRYAQQAVVSPPVTTLAKGAKAYTVQEGDSLWTISRKYPGISVENLREWNGLSGHVLQPGAVLKLCACPS